MKILLLILFLILIQPIFIVAPQAYAATTPNLGQAATFSILSGTYTNTVGGTTLNGDLGYTTPPAVAPTVNGTTHVADGTYNQAGIDQGAALAALASQPCTTTFPPGPVDLATDTTGHAIGVYPPGVYCGDGAADIGGGGTITLTGGGTYIFRIDGALTTSANSVVALAGGASTCDVFWTPTAATTLGANSSFAGTDIGDSGITIGSTVTWEGRALALGGTITTDTDTITVPSCPTPTPSPSGSSSPSPSASISPSPSATVTPSTSPAPTPQSSCCSPTTDIPGPGGGDGGAPAPSSAPGFPNAGNFVPGFPNAGGTPRLPNAGVSPLENNALLYFLDGISKFLSFLQKYIYV